MSLPEEKTEILKILKENKIDFLWHFTDIRNLPYIRKLDGLRSKEYLENNGYLGRRIFPGGDGPSHDLDRRLGNWDKIHLNFRPNTPMAYHRKRETHLVFIEIQSEVAAYEGVYFTDCNATKADQKRGRGIEGLRHVRFNMIQSPYEPRNQDWHRYVQAEVLAPHHIPISMFKAIHFISNASKEYGESLWRGKCNLFCVNQEIFHDTSIYNRGAIQFPYIEEVLISTRKIPKEKVHAVKSNAPYLVQGEPFWVIVYLNFTTGARISISISDIRKKKIERAYGEARSEIDRIFCHQFIAPKGLKGLEVKVYIDTILWTHRMLRCMEME